MGDEAVEAFVANYAAEDLGRIAFAWNRLRADEFRDANEEFRSSVVEFVMENPGRAGLQLIRDLYLAESAWAKEAWGVRDCFGGLAELLLVRGGCAELLSFAQGFVASFDTFGACHQMQLPPETMNPLLAGAERQQAATADERESDLLRSAKELLERLQAQTAADGWARLAPGTPVYNVRMVPPWRLRISGAMARLRRLLGVERRGGPTSG